jgi:hypothetical protein
MKENKSDPDQNKILYDNQLVLQKQIDDQIQLNQSQAQQLMDLQRILAQQQQNRRTLPQSELDLNLMLTDTKWADMSPGLKEKLQKKFIVTRSDGSQSIEKEDLSAMLGFFTRDLRLGNLDRMTGEFNECEYTLNLANDFLKEGFIDPFLVCLSRVASKLDLSQSRGGFLRKRNSSFTTENVNTIFDAPKRNLLGGQKKVE